MTNYFQSPFKGKPIEEQITNPNIRVGRHSYYSGYYHSHNFEHCVRYLSSESKDVDKLIIGSFCSIGSGAVFMMAGNQGHRTDWISTFPFYYQDCQDFSNAEDGFKPSGDTVIGNDVWIGSEAMIMAGVNVGDGAVIASRAVVTKDVEPYQIVGSNPAKHIRYRFSEEEISQLLAIKWWDWSDSELKKVMQELCSGDVAALYHYWKCRADV
ncbi:type B chloramphenicol O-acetyltransferase [Vibrio sp. Of14-4]|uniref:type B chloramphenicol O-acetyltransferase n=1 Tax=Vibrio sp. Of14-4 TaxID=2724878 RepID=UPI001EF31CAA|nr:type B chloramphenicol O-acetyltransferase [Vibrio sp. Of14-4]MCG7491849.1 type B chloramphenicol O-acetyltransferase [Vibrio sp. Of14-4]